MRSYSPSHRRIADALFGKARQRALALLFGAPERRVYLRQIARVVGTGLGSVQRELARLTAAGLLVREREGRQTYYRANPACPVLNELRDLMRKTAGAADVLREALGRLGAPVRVAAIFGSFATGTEREGSEVDLLVIGDATFGEVVDALAPAERALGREINPVVFTPSEYAAKLQDGHHFASSLKTTPKVFAIGDDERMDVLSRLPRAGQLDALRAKRGAIIAAARDHGAHNVRVFGSVARNQADPGSDVDFLVDLESDRSLLDLGGVVSDLEELLGRHVDVVTPRGLGPRLRETVLREALPL